MERIRKYTYKVNQQEKVIFTIHPLNGATKKVTVAQNGETLQDVGGAKVRFEFKGDEPPGNTHFVKIEFSFLQGDSEEAEFELVLRSGGGEKFQDFLNIKKKTRRENSTFSSRFRWCTCFHDKTQA
jgi:hypothetical protein